MKRTQTSKISAVFIFTLFIFPPVFCHSETSDIVKMLTSQLGVSDAQAEGGAGALFKIAQNNLSVEKFKQIAQAVPGMDKLLNKAPETPSQGALGNLTSSLGQKAGSALGMAGLPAIFEKLGMDKGLITQFIPIILSYVQSKGGEKIAELLQSVWKK